MLKVQLRDAKNPGKVHEKTFALPFDPPDGCELRVRDHADDTRHRAYLVVRHYLYEAVINDPDESGIALLVTPVHS